MCRLNQTLALLSNGAKGATEHIVVSFRPGGRAASSRGNRTTFMCARGQGDSGQREGGGRGGVWLSAVVSATVGHNTQKVGGVTSLSPG